MNGGAETSFSASPSIRNELSFYAGSVENKSLEQRNSVVGYRAVLYLQLSE